MSNMTQRYASMLRRYAGDLDKAGATPIKAEAIRQAARHMERRDLDLCHKLVTVREEFERECIDGDELLRILGLEPEQYRTDGGRLNLLRIRAALAERKAA